MKMIVCTRVVPDSETRPKPDAAGKSLDTSDVKWVVNPYDEYAIEQAVQLKEAGKAEHLLLVCLATSDVQKELRTALARGADAAQVLKVPAEVDSFAAAKALADHLKGQDFQLLFFGKEAIDDQQGAIGPMVATLLDLPCVTAIDQFALDGDTATVRRGIEGGAETIKVQLPAVFTADKGLNEPRFTNLKGIMAAKKKPLEDIATTPADSTVAPAKFELPAPRKEGRIIGEGAGAVDELVKLLRDEAKVI